MAIFEAVHGSAPKYAGKDVINPTALILSSVMLLRHIGEAAAATTVEDAVFATLESGAAMTQDLARQTGGDAAHAASTTAFTDAVIANLGTHPTPIAGRPRREPSGEPVRPRWSYGPERYSAIDRRLVGIDVMIEHEADPASLGPALEALAGDVLELSMLSSRGTKVYPVDAPVGGDAVRWFTARYVGREGATVADRDLVELIARVVASGYRWTEVVRLQAFDREPGFTKAQGE